MAITDYERVGKAMELLRDGLASFVERELRAAYGNDWLRKATASWRYDLVLSSGQDGTLLDVAALLRLMWDQWNEVFRKTLGIAERSLVSELREYRNKWAHQNAFSGDDTDRALDSTARLLAAISAPEAEAVRQMKMELRRLVSDEQMRAEQRRRAGTAIESPTTGTLKPWREEASPHADMASGRYQPPSSADRIFVIHAPTWKHRAESAASFQQTLDSRVGQGYAIARTELDFITPGCDVIVLDKGSKRRAHAKLARLEPTGTWTSNHVQRYDVHLKQLTEVRYGDSQTIRLNHRGIAVI